MSENQDHHRLSTEEEDLVHRSAKKIKDDSSSVMDVEATNAKEAPKVSYRDKVMETDSSFELQPEEIVRMVTEELFPDMDISNSNDHGDMEFNPNPNVHVELEEYENWCSPWKYSLIVRLMGKRVGLRFISMKLKHLWAKIGDVRVMDASEDFFLVKFFDEGDYKHTLFEGPWLIADHYLLVQHWRPLFDPLDYTIKKVAVWVEYEGLHLIRFECGKYGHRLDSFPEKKKSEEEQNIQSMSKDMHDSNPQEKQTQADGDEVLFGPWMLAKKISRKRPKENSQQGVTNIVTANGENSTKTSFVSASRFEALQSSHETTNDTSIKSPPEKRFISSTQNSLKQSFKDQKRKVDKGPGQNPKSSNLEPKVQELSEIMDKQKKDDWENEVLAIMSRYNNMRWEAHSKGSGIQDFDSSSNLDRPPDTAKEKGKESIYDGKEGTQLELIKMPEGLSSNLNK
ncbi:hypothetical protein SESBI_27555 [Sesbania bispinosa]|nr:hypothetical protein SESBI_27555 [Sesbania bispinosa]